MEWRDDPEWRPWRYGGSPWLTLAVVGLMMQILPIVVGLDVSFPGAVIRFWGGVCCFTSAIVMLRWKRDRRSEAYAEPD